MATTDEHRWTRIAAEKRAFVGGSAGEPSGSAHPSPNKVVRSVSIRGSIHFPAESAKAPQAGVRRNVDRCALATSIGGRDDVFMRLPVSSTGSLLCAVWMLRVCLPLEATDSSGSASAGAPLEYRVKGVVLALQPEDRRVRIRHEAIPGYMEAMTMAFDVHDTNELSGLMPGEEITFNLLVTDDDVWIEGIEKTGVAENLIPKGAGIRIVREVAPLNIGDTLPDYTFTNEQGRQVSLSQFEGNALVLSFLFTRCPVPTFCPLTARKLAQVQNELLSTDGSPTNWHILAITVDPEFDTPRRLKQFGETYGHNPDRWSLLTGELIDITALAEQFGMFFWTDEGTISHNLRTVVVDSKGVIRTNISGNEWTVGTLVSNVVQAASR